MCTVEKKEPGGSFFCGGIRDSWVVGGCRRWQVPQGQGRWQDCRVSRGPAQAPGLKSFDARGLPGLKPWVMIGRELSGGGAACSGKWTEVHAAAVPPL